MPRIGPAHAYPDELTAFVIARLEELKPPSLAGLSLPDDEDTIRSVLSVAFQTSLLRDEDRPITFRLVVAPPEAFDAEGGPPDRPHRLCFDALRPFTVNELRKLAPAVKYQRSILAVYPVEGELRVWGILHTGPRWLHVVQGGRGYGPVLVSALVVMVSGPGDLLVGVDRIAVARLRAGELSVPMVDVLTSSWLPAMFASIRNEVAEEYKSRYGAVALDTNILGRISRNFVRRIVSTIRAARHGGSVLVVPPDRVQRITDDALVDLKYVFSDEEARRRFRTLVLAMLKDLHAETAPSPPGWADYEASTSKAISEGDDAIFELAHLVGALADVDGLVLMTTRFEIIGFGGVVSGALSDVPSVSLALDVEGTTLTEEPTNATGTRHRAIYRICNAMPDALGIVVSQDGSVRFVRSTGGKVIYWEQLVASAFGG